MLTTPNWLTSVQMVWKDTERTEAVRLRLLEPNSVPVDFYAWSTEALGKLAKWLTGVLEGEDVAVTPLELYDRALAEGLIQEDFELPEMFNY